MDSKISQLGAVINLEDTDVLPIVNGGETKKVTVAQLKSDIGGGVPYTGATQDLNLGEFGLQTGNIEFDLTPTNVPTGVGAMSWNDTDGTLDLKLKGGAVTLQIGQETVARIVNKTATNITLLEANYQAVRVTGAQGQRPKVDLAQANNDLNSTTTLGLVTETILNNQEGFITTSGQVREINTTGSLQGETWADGDILYLSGTVAGRITNIKPIAPIHTVIIGFVEYAHAINGKIFVKVDNGYELDELHNVSAATPNNNDALVYETSTTLWKPKSIITDAIVDGVTTVAPSQNAVFDALALKQNLLGYTSPKIVIKDTTLYSLTGTVTNTIVASYLIPANTFLTNDFIRLMSLHLSKVGSTGTLNIRTYINTSVSLSGANQISNSQLITTSFYGQASRNIFIRSGIMNFYPSTAASFTDITNASASSSTATINTSINNYFIIALQLSSATDTGNFESILITN